MRKNVNDWVSIVLGGLLTCCLLLSMSMFVQAACSGDDYCGISNLATAACSLAKVTMDEQGKKACSHEVPGRSVNCNKKGAEGDCSSCLCKSILHPNAPVVGDDCSCQ
jgi:hypothetical protein